MLKPVLFCLAMSVLCASAHAQPGKAPAEAKPVQQGLKPRDVLGLAGAVGMLGAITADATLGEVFVRAYPGKEIAAEGWGDLKSSIKLSCDTYRSGSGNHMVAAATACHVGYELVAKNPAYTLSGPFRPIESFDGRSCEAARKACGAYRVTVTRKGDTVELRDQNKLLGTVDFSGQTPQYSMKK
jgi:hypothetical protein